jgi:pimeloyl-ACP methyl ester carboxylesterase
MYDFEGRRGGAPSPVERLPRPPLALTALEAFRAAAEHASALVLDTVTPARNEGRGRPVLVIPGFYSSDVLTGRLRRHLRRLGYHVHGWRLGRNYGLTDELIDGLTARLAQLHRQHGQPVTVIGWSFGGLLARWLAHEHPDLVSQVITLGSPWRREGELTRTTPLFERAADRHGLSDRARDIVERLREPLPVPCTAIFSKTEGIVNWRACALDDGEMCENIAVPSSHAGLVANPLALAALADRLAQDPSDRRPFEWRTCLRRAVLGTPISAAATEV